VFGGDFNASHRSTGAGEPDCGVTSKSTNLEHRLGANETALDGEVLALQCGNGDGWEAFSGGVG
jgi:hypothetical protein